MLCYSKGCRILSFLLVAWSGVCQAQTPVLQVNPNTGETQAQFAARTKWWREAKFGMFIHWGIYSVPADSTDVNGNKGVGEWYFNNKRLQVRDYEKFAAQFDPVKFDARKWVKTAKDAGMKYIVITSKHHDGFCMFDSKLTDYSITKATPFKRDPMKELAAECKRQGIRLCFYHSIMDWHHPDYLPRRQWEGANRPADGASLDRYIAYMKGQLRELLTDYGPIGVLWFDGGWEHNADELHSKEVNALIRSLQPGILINDRNHLPEDYSTPEQTIPANALPGGRLWETCMTLNDTWGYAKNDHNWKSSEDLIHKLCDIASKGGNFLLNVGPTDLGEFTPETLDRLAAIGKWMKVNGESIYGTNKNPRIRLPSEVRCTQKGRFLYFHVFKWPEHGLLLPVRNDMIKDVRALDGGEQLRVIGAFSENMGVVYDKPKKLDPFATVIKIELTEPLAAEDRPSVISPGYYGNFYLFADSARIHGGTAQIEEKDNVPNIGFWTNKSDTVEWMLDVPYAGDYTVEIEYACTPDAAGSTYRIGEEGQESVTGTVTDTGGWDKFRVETLPGALRLPAGRQTVRVVPLTMPHGAVMNLRRLLLMPVSKE